MTEQNTSTIDRRVLLGIVVGGLLAVGCAGPVTAYNKTANKPADRNAIKRLVMREARNIGVPVSLALAVAHAESNFNPLAESHAGARGVMQIMPATARGEYGIHPDELWNPRINIRLGLHYLKRLIERYRGRTDLALSFYNGGSRVGGPGRARVIPATRKYVQRVRYLQIRYRQKLRYGRV